MKLFKRNKESIPIRETAARGIASGIIKLQQWFSGSLQGLTKNWKQKQQWVFLYLICLVFGGLSILAVVKPFRISESSGSFIPKSISLPKNIYSNQKRFLITEAEFAKLQEYKNTHPNLIKENPGLYDSLNLIEVAYYSQKK